MNRLDGAVLVWLVVAGVHGFKSGAARQVISIFAWILGARVAWGFAPMIEAWQISQGEVGAPLLACSLGAVAFVTYLICRGIGSVIVMLWTRSPTRRLLDSLAGLMLAMGLAGVSFVAVVSLLGWVSMLGAWQSDMDASMVGDSVRWLGLRFLGAPLE